MNDDRRIRVLLVDDEDRFRTTTTETLRRRGFEVKSAVGGTEAIEELKKGDVDVVVLDIKMPDIDGHQVLRKMKALDPGVEVIMLTGHASEQGSAYEDLHEGAFAYLKKPCGIEFLDLKIREADFARNERMAAKLREKS